MAAVKTQNDSANFFCVNQKSVRVRAVETILGPPITQPTPDGFFSINDGHPPCVSHKFKVQPHESVASATASED